ncbi:hypothetical protein B4923_14520 [Brenneria roseae subsp. americana]|uniref:Uncharacterized protein n=1 Tax=Brenneria roseae subsp. americana TaxID=1508507 RepID=A0A2U1TNX6_9GAMM|nr:hypothetical protein B4923_14520 [Brenneria roseae subsp. americana]
MLVLAISRMGVATMAIGLLSTYRQIGIGAPVRLVLLRNAQGLTPVRKSSAPKTREMIKEQGDIVPIEP